MQSSFQTNKRHQAKTTLAIIIVLAILLPILFWAVVQFTQLNGLPVYFLQLGLYLALFLLAFWGLKSERIALPVNTRTILEAIALLVVGWLVYVLFLQFSGIVRLPDEIQTLTSIPAWKVGAQILSIWFFVGMAEELLFRGYFLASFQRYFTQGNTKRRTITAVILTSLLFSLWHAPVRIVELAAGESTIGMLLLSFVILFVLGMAFAYLFIRTQNIILVGLVHGFIDFPLLGTSTQLSFLILLTAIACVEIAQFLKHRKSRNILQTEKY